ADPHHQSYNGYQPIHYASERGHNECVRILVSKSADTVNEQTNQLFTPLHLACKAGSLETIETLIFHGANFRLRDQNGFNCLHIGKYRYFLFC
ncbi:ankyrin repeat domain-containing protein, partial [Corallococcus sp. AB038B]|uniref:ankyrin repeat domain-containing protein n=1 Tax=Corallococcus sp. AB038B TaxID=2316718 RepID=UPI0011C3D548